MKVLTLSIFFIFVTAAYANDAQVTCIDNLGRITTHYIRYNSEDIKVGPAMGFSIRGEQMNAPAGYTVVACEPHKYSNKIMPGSYITLVCNGGGIVKDLGPLSMACVGEP